MTPNSYPANTANPYQDYLIASGDYWLNLRGDMDPPAPSYREIKGRQKLGRYLDPYGCAGLMQSTKDEWAHWYPSFLVSSAVGPLLTGVGAVFVLLVAPILGGWYLIKRARLRARYDHYWSLLQEIERTGEAVWVPYTKDRLQLIERRPQAIWP